MVRFCCENGKYILEFDEQKGCLLSLKSFSREFIGEIMPLFEISLRDVWGRQRLVNTYDNCWFSLCKYQFKTKYFKVIPLFTLLCFWEKNRLHMWIICTFGVVFFL